MANQTYEEIRSLLDDQNFENFDQVKQAFRQSNQVMLNKDWILQYHDKGNGWRVIPNRDDDADIEDTLMAYFCCVIKGCIFYTYGGIVCPNHKPWELELIHLSSDEEEVGEGIQNDSEESHHVHAHEETQVDMSPTRLGLSDGIMSTQLIAEILDELVESRKDLFGPEQTAEYIHLYSLHSVRKWTYFSKRHNVFIRKGHPHSRSFQLETADGRYVFHTCGHVPFCRNLAVFSMRYKSYHYFCYSHIDDVLPSGSFTTTGSRSLKILLFKQFADKVMRTAGLELMNDTEKWNEMYKFLYKKGEDGQILHYHGYELIVNVSKEGQLKIDVVFSRGTSRLCIGGMFGCLRALRIKSEDPHHSFYCSKCSKLDSRFDFESVIEELTYGEIAGDFFKYT